MGSVPVHMPMEAIMRTPPPRYTSQPSLTSHLNRAFEADDRPPPLYSSKNEVSEDPPIIEPPPRYRSAQSLHSTDSLQRNNQRNAMTSPALNSSFESTTSDVIAPNRFHRRRRAVVRSRRRELPMLHALRHAAQQHVTSAQQVRAPDAVSTVSENEQFFHVRTPRAILRQNQRAAERRRRESLTGNADDVSHTQYQLPGAAQPVNRAQTLPLAFVSRIASDVMTSSVRLHPLDGRVWRQSETVTQNFAPSARRDESVTSASNSSAHDAACPAEMQASRQAGGNLEASEHDRRVSSVNSPVIGREQNTCSEQTSATIERRFEQIQVEEDGSVIV